MAHHIGILLFRDVQQLDLTGPYEVFATLPDAQVHLVAASMEPLRSSTGIVLTPSTTFATCPDLDVICVPGGAGIDALLTDEATLAFIRGQAAKARFVTSVCTGALVLGTAGLLQGKRATTHWGVQDMLTVFGAIPTKARVVHDGTIITGGGVTAGIDFGLAVVAELAGRAAAEAVQLYLEYAPAPPFDAGDPATAPAEVVASVRARMAPGRARRQMILDRMVAERAR